MLERQPLSRQQRVPATAAHHLHHGGGCRPRSCSSLQEHKAVVCKPPDIDTRSRTQVLIHYFFVHQTNHKKQRQQVESLPRSCSGVQCIESIRQTSASGSLSGRQSGGVAALVALLSIVVTKPRRKQDNDWVRCKQKNGRE